MERSIVKSKKNPLVLFRCDASFSIGYGHLVRCLVLANELKNSHNCSVEFAMLSSSIPSNYNDISSYKISRPFLKNTELFEESAWLLELVIRKDVDILILDTRTKLNSKVIAQIREKGIVIATIDDPEDKRIECDLAFYSPVSPVLKLNWNGFKGEVYIGWEWIILRPQFYLSNKNSRQDYIMQNNILVSMGASDPNHLTLLALRNLEKLNQKINLTIIIGKEFRDRIQLNNLVSNSKHLISIIEDVVDMANQMKLADLAIISFGVTAYEAAAIGLPSIHLCISDDHAESSETFDDMGMAITLGNVIGKENIHLNSAISKLLDNKKLLTDMSLACIKQLDGKGFIRIGKKIIDKFCKMT